MTDLRPYQLSDVHLSERLDDMVSVTFADLTSQFMLLPRGSAFVAYEEFLAGYEAVRQATGGFAVVSVDRFWDALRKNALALVAIRCILGVSPPEWEDLTFEETGVRLPSNWARGLDGKVKRNHAFFTSSTGRTALTVERTTLLLRSACSALSNGAEEAPEGLIHRLEKIDTREGLESVRYVAHQHVPYAVLLYERYLGRPFASHRDSVSELVGDVMESAIEEQLTSQGIPFRKTKRAERVPGFDQAPDFFVPDELAPSVIIEAKITGDDGTARDKVSRILRLAGMRDQRIAEGRRGFQVVACIDGRGFGVRRQDLKDLLVATRGKVFTASSLGDLVDNTDLHTFRPD
ncbi:hypothetical protein [Micromonospora sp. WMMD987]|uniref:hypothetical protein n=1 Tax=Micromonospora sp. WMMD987 TaxID=3016089 RepID=UPI00249A1083|nr:hypothetical protein [Micromonospora sp. WMMD987]WFE94124.1 hypothetical protein O7612_22490 [Micromonospora sp. WMMD987]